MPHLRRPRIRAIRTERAGAYVPGEEPRSGVLAWDPVERGVRGAGGGTAVAAAESERPGELAREHFYFVLYFGAAIAVVPRLRLI